MNGERKREREGGRKRGWEREREGKRARERKREGDFSMKGGDSEIAMNE